MKKRFTSSSVERTGRFAPEGTPVVQLKDTRQDICVHVQPECGGDFFRVDNPEGRDFKTRPIEGEVLSPVWDAVLAGGDVYNGLQRVGANITAIPFPGVDQPRHGLHRCLSSVPDNPELRQVDDSKRGVWLTTVHEIQNTMVSNLLDAHLQVLRKTGLEAGPYGTCIHLSDAIWALAPSYAGIINHPNPRLYPGDRVLMPHRRVKVLLERDHQPPAEHNPFIRVTTKFLGQAVNEYCFFICQEPDKRGFVQMLLLGEDGKAVGMRYRYHHDHPFLALWLSRGGYCGLESGNLPLGAKRLHELKMMPLYEASLGWKNELYIDLINKPADAKKFMADHGIDPKHAVPPLLQVCDPDMKELARAALQINRKRG